MARYDLADELLKKLDAELRREINRLDVIGFDELNAMTIKSKTEEMVERLLKANATAFKAIAYAAMKEAVEDLDKLYGTKRKVKAIATDSKEVDKVLKAYNPVTDYLYYPEADRKRSRLSEALIVALMLDSREKYHYQLRKFAHLWHTQTKQYGDTIVDTFREKTFKENGIKYVKWQSEHDDKVCGVCEDMDEKIYKITEIPPKPHYNCRCWIVPIMEKDEEKESK